jgi:hypothetical protein
MNAPHFTEQLSHLWRWTCALGALFTCTTDRVGSASQTGREPRASALGYKRILSNSLGRKPQDSRRISRSISR